MTFPRWLEKSGCLLAVFCYVLGGFLGRWGGWAAFSVFTVIALLLACVGVVPFFRAFLDPRRLVAALEATLGFERTGGVSRDTYARLASAHASGRTASVTLLKNENGNVREAAIGLSLTHAPALVLRRNGLAAALANLNRWRTRDRTGDAAFDGAFSLELLKAGAGAREALLDAHEAIEALLARPGVERLEVQEDLVVAVGKIATLGVDDYGAILDLLARIAPSLERVSLDVRVLGGAKKAFTAHGTPRCAYCHGDITGFEPDLVACQSCSTVLHEGCWAELARCPVLGCTGSTPERARVV